VAFTGRARKRGPLWQHYGGAVLVAATVDDSPREHLACDVFRREWRENFGPRKLSSILLPKCRSWAYYNHLAANRFLPKILPRRFLPKELPARKRRKSQFSNELRFSGEVAEWPKAQHWKCCVGVKPHREFESRPLRFPAKSYVKSRREKVTGVKAGCWVKCWVTLTPSRSLPRACRQRWCKIRASF
jgi:hypothetical protein